MFVVFEGIDGSGKTTVSGRVAKALRARGIPVEHVRESGSYSSALVNRMRAFAKDARNLDMTPMAELLAGTARDVQLAEESIRPALAGDSLVIADRYFYSHAVLAMYGHDLPAERVGPVIQAGAAGLWPDMVVLMDIDPYVARARRQVSKLIEKVKPDTDDKPPKESVGGSRKGLQGVGLQHKLRKGYLEMAAREPQRWLVMNNSDPVNPDSALYAVVARITETIAEHWRDRHVDKPAQPGGRLGIKPSRHIRVRPPTVSLTPLTEVTDFASARLAFFDMLRARASRELAVAAYFLSRLDDEEAWRLRAQWLERAPHVIAYGLRGLDDERAWQLRGQLADVSPHHVARSLAGRTMAGERVWRMRRRFMDAYPSAILSTLSDDDSSDAWAVREQLWSRQPIRVLASLARLDSERAWFMRTRYLEDLERQKTAPNAMDVAPLIKSLRGLGDERAWQLRTHYLELVPTTVLGSVSGLDDEQSWLLRMRYVARAPKIVLATFAGSTDPRAWALRVEYALKAKEALDSMTELDEPEAWRIREMCLDIWPSTTIKSLGKLGGHGRGRTMTERALKRHAYNISLLKHVTRLVNETESRDNGGRDAS